MQTTLSNAQLIQDAVQRSPGDFSAVDVMGSLVNNQKFKTGYDEFCNKQKTEKSYIWEALSAVANDVGQSLFTNVRDYIDNVTDVDVCKVRALKSMMHMVGLDYQLISKVGVYPVEVQSLIDLLSIHKKYLLSNKFIKQDFIDSMSAAGAVLSGASPAEGANADAVSSSLDVLRLSSNESIAAESTFESYISSIYLTFLSDMLEMSGVGLCANTRIIDSLELSDGYGSNAAPVDRYLYKKMQNNVDVSFDVSKTVDAIENGLLDSRQFTGPKLSLIIEEMKYRKSVPEDLSALDLTTRTTYYRKRKVIEYAEFIDNMSHNQDVVSNMMTYKYDPSYFEVSGDSAPSYCISGIASLDNGQKPVVVSADVIKTAKALTQMTQYICKLRESIRLQVRKIFMKGTENLLRFTVNQFLIDYIDYANDIVDDDQLQKYVKMLSAHSVEDVSVQEYWDFTEYMNISTETTQYALNSEMVNDRYFDQTFSGSPGSLVPKTDNAFTNEQINKFYLEDLGLKNTLDDIHKAQTELSSRFYDFLSAIFNVAANPSYYNKSTNEFGTVLTSNTIATQTLSKDLSQISGLYSWLSSFAEEIGFTFNGSTTVSSQISSFENAAQASISSKLMDGISASYNEFYPQVQNLSTSLDGLKLDLSTMLNQTYANYFTKSKNSYSYDQDGNYKFPVYIMPSEDLFMLQLTSASAWIQANCKTSAVIYAVGQLSSSYDVTRANVDALIRQLTGDMSGYVPLSSAALDDEMDNIQSFLSGRAQRRTTYLQNALENLRTQARQLKQDFNQAEQTYSNVLAQMLDTSQGWYMQLVYDGNGQYEMREKGKTGDNADREVVYDQFSQASYIEANKASQGAYSKVYFNASNEVVAGDPLETNIERTLARIEEFKNIYLGTAQSTSGKTASTSKTYGSQKDTLTALKSSIAQMKTQYNSIVKQIQDLYNLPASEFEIQNSINNSLKNKNDVLSRIINLNDYLATKISDAQFSQDNVLNAYNTALSSLAQVSAQYIPEKNEYESLWTLFDDFFADYPKTSDYRLFIPSNISAIDSYTTKKDNLALNQINEQFSSLSSSYQHDLDTFNSVFGSSLSVYTAPDEAAYSKYSYSGTYLENCLSNASKALSDDVTYRTALADIKLAEQMQSIDDNFKKVYSYSSVAASKNQGLWWRYFPNELDVKNGAYKQNVFLQQNRSFLDIVKQIFDKLNYTENAEYQSSKMLFQNYTGVPWVATDPYYNHKNMTHPSYQIHPFLWNFVENNPVDKTLKLLSDVESRFNHRDLDSAFISNKIDGYIGEFGQLVDVWKTHVEDFTGYQTKYERSAHVCGYTGISSEVVDYDGAFYPPAAEDFIASDGHLSSLSAWYKHLEASDNDDASKLIDTALTRAHADVADIMKSRLADKQYDIWKYFEDAYNNVYILYKKIDSSMTSWQKLHAPGELWIRLADSPIAVHAEDVLSQRSHKLLEGLQMISTTSADGSKSEAGKPICDIEMLDNGKKMIITYSNPYIRNDKTYMALRSKSFYVYYDLFTGTGVGEVSLLDVDRDGTVFQTPAFPANQGLDDNGTILDYVGSYPRSPLLVDVLYMRSKHIIDEKTGCTKTVEIPDNPELVLYTVDYEHPVEEQLELPKIEVHNAVGELPAASPYSNDMGSYFLDIAFAVSSSSEELSSSSTSQVVNIQDGSRGPSYSDPVSEEMNSLDAFKENLAVFTVNLGTKTVSGSASQHQLNADMGYTPSYAYGESHNILETDEDDYTAVELLGMSKDLNYLSSRVNLAPDPYATKEDIFQQLVGRAYETDLCALVRDDQSLFIYSSTSMYNGMPKIVTDQYFVTQYAKSYVWDTILDRRLNYEKLDRMKMFIYTPRSYGKNPYVVEDLSNVILSSNTLAEGSFLSGRYDDPSSRAVSGCKVRDGGYDIIVAGTTDGIDQIDYSCVNTLPNILGLEYRFRDNAGEKYIQVKLITKSQTVDAYLEEGCIRVALVDEHDLAMLEALHILCPATSFTDLAKVTREGLANTNLSDWSALSDVEVDGVKIFDTQHRMAFKASEEDVFKLLSSYDNYSIGPNSAYPMTLGQYYKKAFIDYNATTNGKPVECIYELSNVFVMKAKQKDVVEALEKLDIGSKAFDTADEIRVYEDYWHEDADGQLNSDKFAHDNPKFYQYVKFSDDGSDISESPDGFTVPLSCVDGVKVNADGSDQFSKYINQLSICTSKSDFNYDDELAKIFDLTQYTQFELSALSKSDLEEVEDEVRRMLNLNVSFQKNDDGITLYFNYQNYAGSPFLKIEDGKILVDTIASTYAVVKPGQTSNLDVIIQLRQCIGDTIVGIENVVAASYQIMNISDDKPKFLLKKTSSGKLSSTQPKSSKIVAVAAQQIDKAQLGRDVQFTVSLAAVAGIDEDIVCTVKYPASTLRFMSGDKRVEKVSSGLVKCKLNSLYPNATMVLQPTAFPQNDMLQNNIVIESIDAPGATKSIINGWIRCQRT